MNKPPKPSSPKYAHLPYRLGVGIVLFNDRGEVFVGARLDNPGNWQMPQGGIDEGEDPLDAVFREMEEEIGTRNAKIISVMEEWLHYDVPDHMVHKLWGGRYRGQKQKWVALRFQGVDRDINIHAHRHPEFREWKWVSPDRLLDLIVPFKRDVYTTVIEHFKEFTKTQP